MTSTETARALQTNRGRQVHDTTGDATIAILLDANGRVAASTAPYLGSAGTAGLLDRLLPPDEQHLESWRVDDDSPDSFDVASRARRLLVDLVRRAGAAQSARSHQAAMRVDAHTRLELSIKPMGSTATPWLVLGRLAADAEPAHERLVSVLSALDAGVLIEDELRRISLVNDQFCALFDIPAPPAALVGADCESAANGSAPLFADPVEFLARVELILAARQPVLGELLEMQDGRVLARDFVPITGADGVALGNVWMYRDVSAVRAAQAQLTADVEHGERMLAITSHELRTPLNGIIGMLELIADEPLAPSQHELVAHAEDAADALLRVVDDLLDVQRLHAGRFETSDVDFVLEQLLQQARDWVGAGERDEPDDVTIVAGLDESVTLRGDAGRIRQILFNLIANARRHGRSHTIELSAEVEHATASPDRVRVRFAVRDHGPGLGSADPATLFAPFQQGHDSGPGSGLGLWICRELVEAMGGSIEIRDATDGAGGAIATFELPLTVVAAGRPLLDLDQLAELVEDLSASTVAHTLEVFVDLLDARLERIRTALREYARGTTSDAALADAMHALASPAATVGAVRLSDACGDLERDARAGLLDADSIDLASLEEVANDTRAAASSYARSLEAASSERVHGPSR